MDFATTIAQVMAELKRPDKATTAKLAINSAITQLTLSSAFPRDLMEVSYAVPGNEQGDFNLSVPLTNFPGQRRFKYIRAINDTKTLVKRQADKVFTREGYEQFGSYYTAGTVVQMKLRAPTTQLLVGYYLRPTFLVEDLDTHWMLDDFPTVIIAMAIAISFQSIGQDKDAKSWQGIAQLNARALGLDLVEAA